MRTRTKINIRYFALSAGTFAATYLVTGSGILALLASVVTVTIMTGAGDA